MDENVLLIVRTLLENKKNETALQMLEANPMDLPEWYYLNGKCQCRLKNYGKGLEYFQKAAEAGHVEAIFQIGMIYDFGNTGEKDMGKAVQYYSIAAEKGYPGACLYLSDLYKAGAGVSEDNEKSLSLLFKAVDLGDKFAEYTLACRYNSGDGIAENPQKAFELAMSSYTKGYDKAGALLGEMYAFGIGCEQDYDKALSYLLPAAYNGHVYSMYLLGECYLFGDGTKPDIDRAYKWLKEAVDHNIWMTSAYFNLGKIYNDRNFSGYDPKEALRLFQIVKEKGDVKVCNTIGDIYKYYYGDNEKAIQEYTYAYSKGDVEAEVSLGLCYLYGEGVPGDINKAFTMFENASRKGSGRGYYWIAKCWENGWLGGLKDINLAKVNYENALRKGFSAAQEELNRLSGV